MESRDLKRRDLERLIGSRARVSEVFNRKQALTMEMIRKLHKDCGLLRLVDPNDRNFLIRRALLSGAKVFAQF